jgi:hypothetical protein
MEEDPILFILGVLFDQSGYLGFSHVLLAHIEEDFGSLEHNVEDLGLGKSVGLCRQKLVELVERSGQGPCSIGIVLEVQKTSSDQKAKLDGKFGLEVGKAIFNNIFKVLSERLLLSAIFF